MAEEALHAFSGEDVDPLDPGDASDLEERNRHHEWLDPPAGKIAAAIRHDDVPHDTLDDDQEPEHEER